MEPTLTEFPGTVSSRPMGRPPIKEGKRVKQAAVWLHEDLLERIRAVAGKQGFSEFMREAAERELKRVAKSAAKERDDG